MSADDHSTIAGRELLGIIRELEAEEAAIRDHNKVKSDIIKEAGNKGYDKKTIRKVMAARRLDPLERDEQDHLFDMYMHAVETAEKEVAHARVENAGKFGAAKPITDTQEQPETDEPCDYCADHAPAGEYYRCPKCDAEWPAEDEDNSPSAAPPADTVAEPQAAQPATVSHSNPQPAASLGADTAGDVPPPSSPATLSEADVPAFLKPEQRKSIADYRPNCRHPDACGATGLTHCYTCRKAMEAASETEAA